MSVRFASRLKKAQRNLDNKSPENYDEDSCFFFVIAGRLPAYIRALCPARPSAHALYGDIVLPVMLPVNGVILIKRDAIHLLGRAIQVS